jgi:thiaminase (transcriptional activator TenA)
MKFTDRLHEVAQPIWEANHKHPFVQGIGHGTLEVEKFKFYMIQDYLYLIEYSKLFALGVVKANDLATMGKFAGILNATLNSEMGLHRQYAKRLGITLEELEKAEAAPTTLAYNHYMLSISQSGSLAELIAGLLPCMWSYWEIGKELGKIPGATEHEFYGEWIRMYADDEFGKLSIWLMDLINELTIGKSEKGLQSLEEIFITSSRFEYTFWDMAYNQKTWPEEISFLRD